MSYDCPECGWDPPDNGDFDRYIINKKLFRKKKVVMIGDFWVPVDKKEFFKGYKPNPKYDTKTNTFKNSEWNYKDGNGNQIYPIIKNFGKYSNIYGCGSDWVEVHCCPKHGEFQFSNGT